jgi:hypothetical protein
MRFRIQFSLDSDDEGYDYQYTSTIKLLGGEDVIDKLVDSLKYNALENSYIDLKQQLKTSKGE